MFPIPIDTSRQKLAIAEQYNLALAQPQCTITRSPLPRLPCTNWMQQRPASEVENSPSFMCIVFPSSSCAASIELQSEFTVTSLEEHYKRERTNSCIIYIVVKNIVNYIIAYKISISRKILWITFLLDFIIVYRVLVV